MPVKRINPKRIKIHRCYSTEEVAAALDVHKNSLRGWRKAGLEPIDMGRPMLFHGATLRAFLEKQKASRKRPCQPGTMYCLKCREPRAPGLAMVDYEPISDQSGNLKALCEKCGTTMHRRASRAKLASIMPGIAVQIVQAPSRLKGCISPSLNCDLDKDS